MSLFKAREWWATIIGDDEQFDQGCMCIGNLDNHSSGTGIVDGIHHNKFPYPRLSADKIVVGSYHGFLRIYNPRPIKTENGYSGFRPEDVMCETSLNAPILQVQNKLPCTQNFTRVQIFSKIAKLLRGCEQCSSQRFFS
jgi:Bardet-Biedl syndrome 9 protein